MIGYLFMAFTLALFGLHNFYGHQPAAGLQEIHRIRCRIPHLFC